MNADVTKCGGIWRAFQLLETSLNLQQHVCVSWSQCALTTHFKKGIEPQELLLFPTSRFQDFLYISVKVFNFSYNYELIKASSEQHGNITCEDL